MAILYQDFLVLPNLCKLPRPQEEWPMILEKLHDKSLSTFYSTICIYSKYTTKSCNISMSTERKQPWGPLFCFFLCLWSVSIKHTRKTRDCPWLLRRHQCRFAPGDSPGWKEVQILMKWQGGNLRYQIPDTRRANLHRHSVADNTPSAMYLLRTLIVASGPSKD